MEYEGYGNTNCNWYAPNNPLSLCKRTGRLRNRRISGDHEHCIIIKIGKNLDDLKRRAVTQTPLKFHQITLL